MIDYEYILKIEKKDIDLINKITEAYEGLANVRTLDSKIAYVRLLTNIYFIEDIQKMFNKLREVYDMKIEILSEGSWKGEV